MFGDRVCRRGSGVAFAQGTTTYPWHACPSSAYVTPGRARSDVRGEEGGVEGKNFRGVYIYIYI